MNKKEYKKTCETADRELQKIEILYSVLYEKDIEQYQEIFKDGGYYFTNVLLTNPTLLNKMMINYECV